MAYRLRTLIALITLACLAFFWVGVKRRQEQQLMALVDRLSSAGAIVSFDYQLEPDGIPPGPKWLRRLVGENAFAEVVAIDSGRELTDKNVQDVLLLPSIRILDLARNHYVSEETLKSISRCPNLEVLCLRKTKLTDQILAVICASASIRKLDVSNTGISDASMSAVADCESLRRLDLGYTNVTSQGLQSLSEHPALESVDLDGTNVNTEGIASLAAMRHLKHLSVCYTDLSDEAITPLLSIDSLRVIYVLETRFSQSGIQTLRDAAQNLKVKLYNM